MQEVRHVRDVDRNRSGAASERHAGRLRRNQQACIALSVRRAAGDSGRNGGGKRRDPRRRACRDESGGRVRRQDQRGAFGGEHQGSAKGMWPAPDGGVQPGKPESRATEPAPVRGDLAAAGQCEEALGLRRYYARARADFHSNTTMETAAIATTAIAVHCAAVRRKAASKRQTDCGSVEASGSISEK